MTVMNQRFSILKQPIASVLNQHLIDYPTPSNLSYWWGFGSLDGILMHYTPHVDLAFNSVEHIMRDVEGGWLLRYRHANGASMFFIFVYVVVIFLLMILTAFIGYVLPFWVQMSLRELLSLQAWFGDTIVTWLWGGFSVDNATLNRFFSLHFLLPFILVVRQCSSSSRIASIWIKQSFRYFYPYFYVKDLVGWVAFAIFLSVWIFYAPNVLGHPDNYIPANTMSTSHIVPEWYFLPVYAILVSIPDKAGALPFMKSLYVRSSSFRPIYQGLFWLLLADRCLLDWIGCQPVEPPFVTIGQISPLFFFLFFAILPLLGLVGRGIPHSYTDEPLAEKDPISVRH
ncbi:hypothetical protein MKW92_009412 [Papaver armeniacum]|nr:hypothetical protein MKW92_009412 [Papaver armeniacum]